MTPASPADLARAALRRIAEQRIAPTPQHFARHYYEAAGVIPPSGVLAGVDSHWVQRADVLIGKAAATTGQLATGLDRRSGEMAACLAGLVEDAEPGDTLHLLHEFVASAKDMQATVRASHAELLDTRRSLADIKAELIESRKLLGQDPLTGTENRRSMGAILQREINRARSESKPLAVAMVDVDHFKRINDTCGHAAGDAALVHLTGIARSMLRGNDAFIRYGGEEFLMVLPETGLQGGTFVAGRLQALLEKTPLVHDGEPIAMTFSAGVSALKDDDTEETLIRRADTALYEAKRTGRKRVIAIE